MKKLSVTFNGTTDTTGYLFSFAKCLSAALRCGGLTEDAEDIVAASGFAFRMWVNGESLCPSATSIWDFKMQKAWVENGGFSCDYIQRLWGEDALEKERREGAIAIIKKSIDAGMAAIAWDLSGGEWGLAIGYDEETKILSTLRINGKEAEIPYEALGNLEIPILSVLAVGGKTEKKKTEIVADTKKIAADHLLGKEWCDNAKGLAAYDALCGFISEKYTDDVSWNLDYYLGTYAALKWYAWQFFEKYNEKELAALYHEIHLAWQKAFDLKRKKNMDEAKKSELLEQLTLAKKLEHEALKKMLDRA